MHGAGPSDCARMVERSSSPHAGALTTPKKREQRSNEGAVGPHVDLVDPDAPERSAEGRALVPEENLVAVAQLSAVGVDGDFFSSLRITQHEQAELLQCLLGLIPNVDGNDIVPPRNQPQRFFPAGKRGRLRSFVRRVEYREIAEQENDGAMA